MKIITTYIFILFSILTFAQNGKFRKVTKPKLVAEKLNSASKKTKSIDSDFKQFKHLDILENDIESTGHFSFQATDKVRWEYIKPYKYLIIMNNGNMWINNGNKTKKYDTNSNKMFKEINDLMLGMLQGQILKSEKFEVNFFENNKYVLAKLKPKSSGMKEFLTSMNLYFDKKDYNVSKIKMIEHSGDFTLIEFFNRKINIEIPNSKFLVR